MPDPFKQVKIIELMELFDDEEVTTADGGRIPFQDGTDIKTCLLYTSPSPRDS